MKYIRNLSKIIHFTSFFVMALLFVVQPMTARRSKKRDKVKAHRVGQKKSKTISSGSRWRTTLDASSDVRDLSRDALVTKNNEDAQARRALEGINKKVRRGQAPVGIDENGTIELQFEDTDLYNVMQQIAELFDITFITDDSVQPLTKGGKALKGNKISFKTHKPLSKQEAWNLFLTFLDIAGLTVVPEADPSVYRVVSIETGRKSPLPSFIGTALDQLPDNDQMIRYLYFIENGSLDTIKSIVDSLRSPGSGFTVLKDLNAFLLTDKAYNIKSLMEIIRELDTVSLPQSMSVLKLQRADANDVKKLFDALLKIDDKSITARLFPAKKQPTALYFPENTRIIAETRTNSLILLGPQSAIKKIEDFVVKYVDVGLGEETRSPLRVYQLQFADARDVAAIMNDISKFGGSTSAGKSGGVRDGDKYIKPLVFIAEPETNQIIIKGDQEDYIQALPILERLDEPQPQIAVEALIVTISLRDTKELGTQLRSKQPGHDGLTGKNVKFQTSGLRAGTTPSGFVVNTEGAGVKRLLGDLICLAQGAISGNTIVSLGSDACGVWGIFAALESVSNAQVISNPFITATNKQKATLKVGEKRRVQSSIVTSGNTQQDSFTSLEAALKIEVTPQINSDGMIVLDLLVSVEDFVNPDETDATKRTREIETTVIVANKEVIALGGLIRNKDDAGMSKFPILGNIPILGWLFKNKRRELERENLLILLSTRIIPAGAPDVQTVTKERVDDYYRVLDDMQDPGQRRDPVSRFFFAEDTTDTLLDDFLFKRNREVREQKQEDKKAVHWWQRRKKKKEKKEETVLDQQLEQSSFVHNVQKEDGARIPVQATSLSGVLSEKDAQVIVKSDVSKGKATETPRGKRSWSDFFSEDKGGVSI